jgi:predicted rRNA methylase YqxC with S4 and FtsJ domains
MKERLDVLLVERGLATSREKAKAMIMGKKKFSRVQRKGEGDHYVR